MSKVRSSAAGGWPLSSATVRAVLSGHSILGLAFAAIIYLVCLTGTIAVFAHDLERWEQPPAPVVTALSDRAIARAVVAAAAQAPKDSRLYVTLPTASLPGASVLAYSPAFERSWSIDQAGTLVAAEAAWSEFLLALHINLHLPRTWGEFIVGLTGVALLSSLLSGVLAHPRIFKDAFHLRLGGSRRLQEADLHNRFGVWALPFHFVIALTGALLGLSTIIVGVLALLLYRGDTGKVYALFIDPPPAVNASPAPLPDIVALLTAARQRASGAVPQAMVIEHPGRRDARITINSGRSRMLVQQDQTSFDANGRSTIDRHPEDLATGTRILGGIGQLHFGWYGGGAIRIVYGLLGLALCVVTSSGVTIWLARRRDKGRASALCERLWAAVSWGQPFILALTALLAVVAPVVIGPILPGVWLSSTLVALGGAALLRRTDGIVIARCLRAALAVTLVTTALAHLALTGLAGGLVVWLVNMALAIGGAELLRRGVKARTMRRHAA